MTADTRFKGSAAEFKAWRLRFHKCAPPPHARAEAPVFSSRSLRAVLQNPAVPAPPRDYPSAEVEIMRLELWLETDDLIRRRNADPTNTAVFGHNAFSAHTREEKLCAAIPVSPWLCVHRMPGFSKPS